MKVRNWVSLTVQGPIFTLDCVNRMPEFIGSNDKKPSILKIPVGKSYYIWGGRKSIAKFCMGDSVIHAPSHLTFSCVRGTIGADKPNPDYIDESLETVFANEIGAYKRKTITLVRITSVTDVGMTGAKAIYVPDQAVVGGYSAWLRDIPELIYKYDKMLLSSVLEQDDGRQMRDQIARMNRRDEAPFSKTLFG